MLQNLRFKSKRANTLRIGDSGYQNRAMNGRLRQKELKAEQAMRHVSGGSRIDKSSILLIDLYPISSYTRPFSICTINPLYMLRVNI
jgi:hypothetical protein